MKLSKESFRFTNFLFRISIFIGVGILQLHAQDRKEYSLLWEVKADEESMPSYVFGTMHTKTEKLFEFPDQLVPALKSVEAFAMEIHPDSILANVLDLVEAQDLKSQTKNVLSEKELDKLNERLKDLTDKPLDSLDSFNFETIRSYQHNSTSQENDKDTFMDTYLYGIAKNSGKSIYGLEDAKDQIALIQSYFEEKDSITLRQNLLEFIHEEGDSYEKELNKLTNLYYEGNHEKLYDLVNSMGRDRMDLINRNKIMVNSMIDIMKNQSVFTAVGAAHLAGSEGVLSLLIKKGYSVKPVVVSFNNNDNYDEEARMKQWIEEDYPEMGFSVEVPSTTMITGDDNFQLHMYFDIVSNQLYMYGVVVGPVEFNAGKSFMENMAYRSGSEPLSVKETELNGVKKTEGIIKKDGQVFFVETYERSAKLYVFAYGNSTGIKDESAIYFFDSIKWSEIKVPKNDLVYTEFQQAAMATTFPETYSSSQTETINPEDEEGAPYILHLNQSYREQDKTRYLLRYNDFPNGYYLIDQEESISSYIANLEEKGIGTKRSADTTSSGLPYVRLELDYENEANGLMRLFFRGNRMYMLLSFKDNENGIVDEQHPFFNDFTFLPFKNTPFNSVEETDYGVSFTLPGEVITELVETEDDSEYTGFKTISGIDSDTGGAYLVNVGTYKKYMCVENVEEYLNDVIEFTYKEYQDSIVVKKPIKINNHDFRYFEIENPRTQVKKCLAAGIVGNTILILQAYVGNEEIGSPKFNDFFQDVKWSKDNNFDITKSKIDLILHDLVSNDSIVSNAAYNGLAYTSFSESEASKLIKALERTYENEHEEYSTKELILMHLSDMELSKKNVKALLNYYRSNKTDEFNKALVLEYLDDQKHLNTNELIDLFSELPKKDNDTYSGFVLSGISKKGIDDNDAMEKIISLAGRDDIRYAMLSKFSSFHWADSTFAKSLNPYTKQLMSYYIKDVHKYKDTLNMEDVASNAYSQIYYYHLLFHGLDKEQLKMGQPAFEEIYKLNENNWIVSDLIATLIKLGIEVPESVIAQKMESLSNRYEIMHALKEANRAHEIPEAYLTAEAFSELSAFSNFYDEFDVPSEFLKLGEFTYEDQLYVAYKGVYSEEEYVVFSKVRAADFESFDLNDTYFDWNEGSDNWEQRGMELLKED